MTGRLESSDRSISRLHSLSREEVLGADERLFRGRPPGSIQVLGTSDAAVKDLQRILEVKGARFKTSEPVEVEPPPASRKSHVELEVEGLIDQTVWRAVAKIAFNYLAKIRGAAYVLHERCDRIRAFIMGELRERALVRYSRRPILVDDSLHLRTNEMHLVLFEKRGYALQGRVSLFNSFTYDVMLCPDLGLIYPIKSGHAFDPIRKDGHELAGISRALRI